MSDEDEKELSFGQMLAINECSLLINRMIGNGMDSAKSCRIIAKSIDDDRLPLNSAHFRAAGLHFLEAVEQLVKGIIPDNVDPEHEETLADFRRDIETCRAELTK